MIITNKIRKHDEITYEVMTLVLTKTLHNFTNFTFSFKTECIKIEQ